MDNKLSELSKPAGRFAFEPLAERWHHIKHGERQNLAGNQWELKKLYSQEYVSALDKVAQFWIGESAGWKKRAEAAEAKAEALLAELEAKDKHITTVTEEREFWRERVEGAEKEREELRRRFNTERAYSEDADTRIKALDMRNAELNSTVERWAVDRAESAQRIAELEQKLATPVRLPEKFSMLHRTDFYEDYQSMMAFKADEVTAVLRVAGFTVEGDE